MLQRRLWLAASIIAVVIVGGFALSVPHTREAGAPLPAEAEQENAVRITFTDTSRRGLRTISGSVLAPDACSILHATSSLEGDASTTEKVIVTLDMPPSTGVCLELPTEMAFSTALMAPASIPLEIHINGVLATTTAP